MVQPGIRVTFEGQFTLSPHRLLDNPTVQQPFSDRSRNYTLAFQYYDLSPGCIVQ